MATTQQPALAEALCAIETGVAKPVQAPRLTRAQLVAKLTATGFEQAATFTDINGVERPTTSVRVYGGEAPAYAMAAE